MPRRPVNHGWRLLPWVVPPHVDAWPGDTLYAGSHVWKLNGDGNWVIAGWAPR